MQVVWYDSPEAVNAAFWRPVAEDEGITLEDLLSLPMTGQDEHGNIIELSPGADIAGMRAQGCWGFMDTADSTIHAWAAPDADPAMVIHMLAHEIGHATGTPLDDDLQEELRAEQFGQVARQAFAMLAAMPARGA